MGWDKLPDRDEEVTVLGCVLRDGYVLDDVARIVCKEHFTSAVHQEIFRAMLEIRATGSPVDMASIADNVHRSQKLDSKKLYSQLVEMREYVATGGTAIYYAKKVRDSAIIRDLLQVSQEIAEDCKEKRGTAQTLIESAEKRIFEIAESGVGSDVATLAQSINDAWARIDERSQRSKWGLEDLSLRGVPTGFVDLDQLTSGFQNGELVVVAARPSIGKTSLGIGLARNACIDYALPILFISLEQSRIELAERLICCQAQIDSNKLRSGHLSADDHEKIISVSSMMREAKMFFDDGSVQGLARIGATARRLKRTADIRLLLIDYLQLIEPEKKRSNRQEEVAEISRRLKQLARELKIPVVAMAQLNRAIEYRSDPRPRLSDLRESGAIEADADTVIFLDRCRDRDGEPKEGCLELIVAKQRNGPTGAVTLAFLKPFMRFENYASA